MTKKKKADPAIGHNEDFSITANELTGDLKELADLKKAGNEQNGKLRNRLKSMQTDRGYHPKALAMIRSLDDMSETGRRDVLRTFIPMFNCMMDAKYGQELRGDLFDANDGAQKLSDGS